MEDREKKMVLFLSLLKKFIKMQSETPNDMIYSHIKLQFNRMCMYR